MTSTAAAVRGPSAPGRVPLGLWRACAPAAALLLLGAGDALAAEAGKGPSEVVFVTQLIVLMLVGRLLGEAMNRIGQPSVMGMLLGGILLGPSALGTLWPDLQHAIFPRTPEQKAMLDGISQFGILLLLLLTGMETDLRLVRKVGRAAISISLSGVAVPFACGFALGQFMPEALLPHPDQRLLTSLFLGTALSISSIKIVAAIVREMGFTRRNLGQIIVASAICEDSIGWVIIAITFGLAEAGTINLASVSWSVLGAAAFLVASFTVGRRVVFFLIRWANDNFESDFPVITTILVIMGLMALTTHFIGVHTVLGAFVAGVLIGESPILSKHIDEQLRGMILAFFMPVFFGVAGLSADLTVLKDPELALMALGLIAIASVGKFGGAFIGGKIGGLTRRESLALGCGMNARGSTEVIVATIGLSMGALSQNLFTMIVAMAVVTTMAMPPMLRWALRRVPMRKAEKERLEREEQEAKGFVPNLERLLLAADDSPNGKFAARLAGLVAGPRGMPITVLPLEPDKKPKSADAGKAKEAETKEPTSAEVAKAAAESTRSQDQDETPLSPVDVTVRARAEFDRGGGRPRGRERSRPAGARNQADQGPVRRISCGRGAHRRGIRRTAGAGGGERGAAREAGAVSGADPGAGRRHRRVAARRRGRDRDRARLQRAGAGALCVGREAQRAGTQPRRAPAGAGAGHPQGHRRDRRPLRRRGDDGGARRHGARRGHPRRGEEGRLRPHHHGGEPAARREAVLRRHRGVGVREGAGLDRAGGELITALATRARRLLQCMSCIRRPKGKRCSASRLKNRIPDAEGMAHNRKQCGRSKPLPLF